MVVAVVSILFSFFKKGEPFKLTCHPPSSPLLYILSQLHYIKCFWCVYLNRRVAFIPLYIYIYICANCYTVAARCTAHTVASRMAFLFERTDGWNATDSSSPVFIAPLSQPLPSAGCRLFVDASILYIRGRIVLLMRIGERVREDPDTSAYTNRPTYIFNSRLLNLFDIENAVPGEANRRTTNETSLPTVTHHRLISGDLITTCAHGCSLAASLGCSKCDRQAIIDQNGLSFLNSPVSCLFI